MNTRKTPVWPASGSSMKFWKVRYLVWAKISQSSFSPSGVRLEERVHAQRFHGEVSDAGDRAEQEVRLVDAVLHFQRGERAEEFLHVKLRRLVVDHHEQPALAVFFGQFIDGKRVGRRVGIIDDAIAIEVLDARGEGFAVQDERQFSSAGRWRPGSRAAAGRRPSASRCGCSWPRDGWVPPDLDAIGGGISRSISLATK